MPWFKDTDHKTWIQTMEIFFCKCNEFFHLKNQKIRNTSFGEHGWCYPPQLLLDSCPWGIQNGADSDVYCGNLHGDQHSENDPQLLWVSCQWTETEGQTLPYPSKVKITLCFYWKKQLTEISEYFPRLIQNSFWCNSKYFRWIAPLTMLSMLMLTFNSSVNLFIYCFCNKIFRYNGSFASFSY